ncbi:hypothetical protein THAR02_07222 [Trichoderma harzianum]|uniref:Aminotransferase class I/classII large domain-containing protein n=1 Tax=Trichoderma harzianum TaxID=5544 RepID=A0A0F9XJN3_TRIHA|nr:hypothetical protein THAR02_07222 [Trichoderma harzianum]
MLSRRAIENNAWFREQFKRPLARQGSKNTSIIDMATAENWLIRPQILSILKRNCAQALKEEHLSYANGLGGSSELLESLSTFFNHFFSPMVPIRPEHIITGTGCSAVLDTLIHDICDIGDGLLVTAPMWVYVPFGQSQNASDIVEAYRSAAEKASCKIRGILFCNPHNPHGHICPPEGIDGLLKYCQEADLHFISDEIYALSTFGDRGESSGCLVSQANKELRMSQAILNNAKLCNAATVMISPMLSNTFEMEKIVDLNTKRLHRAAQIAIQFAEFHHLEYYKPVAGLYIWLRLSTECATFDDEEALVQRCSQFGVFVGSGADYSEPQPGWFRLTFAIPEDKLIQGLRRIEEAVGFKVVFATDLGIQSWATVCANWWRGI